MEPGRADRQVTDAAAAALRRLAARLVPALEGAAFTGEAGVRAATPDGLPLVGPSALPGVFLATGARRNGWLLAPLVAELSASYLAGRDPGPHAGLMVARRFVSS
jgi:glycine oxidase